MGLSMRRRRKGQLAVAIAHSVLNLVLFLGGALLVAVSVYSMQLLGTGPGAVPAARPLPSTQPTAPAPPTAPHRRAPHATEPPARPMHLSLVVGVASIVIVALSVPSHFGRPKKPCVCLYQALLLLPDTHLLPTAYCLRVALGSSEEALRLRVLLRAPGAPPPRHRHRRCPSRGGLRDPAGCERRKQCERRRLCARLSGRAAAGALVRARARGRARGRAGVGVGVGVGVGLASLDPNP